MSHAFKCDGPCEQLYEGGPAYVYEKEYGAIGTDRPPSTFELCDNCASRFKSFLDGGKR